MITITNKISKNRFKQLANSLPKQKKIKVELLYLFLTNYIAKIDISLVTVKVFNNKRNLLFLPQIDKIIDYEFRSEIEFLGGEHFINPDVLNNQNAWELALGKYWDKISDFRNELGKIIGFNKNISYLNINDIVNLKKEKVIINKSFVDSLTDYDYYQQIGMLNQYDMVDRASTIKGLFGLDYNDEDTEPNGDFVFEGLSIREEANEEVVIPAIYIYSTFQYQNILGLSKNYHFIRETGKQLDRIDKNKSPVRYVFMVDNCGYFCSIKDKETNTIYDFYIGNNSKQTIKKWSEEMDKQLCFIGVYQLQYDQSEKEGLLVWKLISKSIKL